MQDTLTFFDHTIKEHATVIDELLRQHQVLARIAELMVRALNQGRKIIWCGNGGSAADSQHLAGELVGRFLKERRALPSIALTSNTSILTAIGNDYGYGEVFRRQVQAVGIPGDVLVGISTSGNSENVCNALIVARDMGIHTVAFTGQGGGAIATLADEVLHIPSTETPRIQEGHLLCGHMLCDYIERCVL